MAVEPGLCKTWSETSKTGFLASRLIYFYKGVTPTYTKWQDGQGGTTRTLWNDHIKYEKCATIVGGYTWQWDDVDCDDSNYVVCETYAVE